MINRMIRLMWPKLTSAILLEVVKAVKPIVQQNLYAVSAAGSSQPGVLQSFRNLVAAIELQEGPAIIL
jgi:hypothetical protein